jgi:hypothetical protein
VVGTSDPAATLEMSQQATVPNHGAGGLEEPDKKAFINRAYASASAVRRLPGR